MIENRTPRRRAPWILTPLCACLAACGGDSGPSPDPATSDSVASDSGPSTSATGAPDGSIAEPGAPPSTVRLVDLDDPEVQKILETLTEPPPDADGLEVYDWLDGRRAFMESLSPEESARGTLMMATFAAGEDLDVSVRRGLVEAIARTACPGSPEFLRDLIEEYGEDLGVRTTAAEYISMTSPEVAVEVLEPHLVRKQRGTYPPAETMLKGWLDAMDRLDRDPSRILALVSTDLYRDDATRHKAVRALGDCDTDEARAALETVLVESTGNAYLRRLAAQEVVGSFPRDEACELLERVLNLEADLNMQVFLANLVTQNCP